MIVALAPGLVSKVILILREGVMYVGTQARKGGCGRQFQLFRAESFVTAMNG
jgi:hypothetical protein